MKRIILTSILLIATFTGINAQSYDKMWKSTYKAIDNDLPKTASEHVRAIYAKAVSENNGGQMLKAALVSLQMREAVSPDSAAAYLVQLDSAAVREKQDVVRALFNLVLGRLHAARQNYNDPAEGDKALVCYRAAVADMNIFDGHRADEFVPVIEKGADSKYFDHDLLNFVCRETLSHLSDINYSSSDKNEIESFRRRVAHSFIEHYRNTGNNDAIVLATLDSLDCETAVSVESAGKARNEREALLLQLTEKYSQNTCAVEAYIKLCEMANGDTRKTQQRLERARLGVSKYPSNPRTNELRNIITSITRPTCRAEFSAASLFENQSVKVPLTAVNVGKVSLAFYRLPYAADDAALANPDMSELCKKKSRPSFTVSVELNRMNDYDEITDTVTVALPRKGVYLTEISTDGKVSNTRELLYVGNLRIMQMPLPDKKSRMIVVDAKSGNPVAGAKVKAYRNDGNERKLLDTYTADSEGQLEVSDGSNRRRAYYFPSKDDDVYSPALSSAGYTLMNRASHKEPLNAKIFTDRTVYRPGQKVHVGGFVYKRDDDNFECLYEQKISVELRDANSKKIATRELASDEFGAFGADFNLPQSCLPGTFTVRVNNFYSKSFRVEEYKRPTFDVKVSMPDETYSAGDTVTLKGCAETFAGAGVANAKVTYSVTRRPPWIYARSNPNNTVTNDTTTTDSDGSFVISVPLTQDADIVSPLRGGYACFMVEITVTSPDGESQTANKTIRVGKEPADFVCNMPERVLKSRLPRIMFSLTNASGTEIRRSGEYNIYMGAERVASSKFETNESVEIPLLSRLASGSYRLEAKITDDPDSAYTLSQNFTLFSLDDKRPADNSDIWSYASSQVLSRDSDVTVQLGTSLRNIVAFYDVFGDNKLIESRRFLLNDTIINTTYRYKEEYGHGLGIVFSFMRDGKVYSRSLALEKPKPDKRLRFKWATFRDRLQPGQKEEWTLNVYEPDGSPAKASAVATLYDASLDKFGKNIWDASLGFYRHIAQSYWISRSNRFSLYADMKVKYLSPAVLDFDEFDENVFYEVAFTKEEALFSLSDAASPVARSGKKQAVELKAGRSFEIRANAMAEVQTTSVTAASSVLQALEGKVSGVATAGSAPDESENIPDIKTRENFAETAYFAPALKTDDNGSLQIAFTVPESLTRWNFKLLAHTVAMNIGLLDTTAVVTKNFMVQPNLPRFLRAGDKAAISAVVRNQTSASLSGTAYLTLLDAQTETVIATRRSKFTAKGNSQTVVQFEYEACKDYPVLICKITADAGTYSDGEQRYLPVLADETENLSALPFTMTGKGTHTVLINDSRSFDSPRARNKRVTVEYTANPLWYVVQALPAIHEPACQNAVSIASAFYATTLERAISELSPELAKAAKQWASEQTADTLFENTLLRNEDLRNIVMNETPWATESDNIELRRRNLARAFDRDASSARARNLLERLTLLQQSDGGWSWFPGMHSNYHITLQVLDMLVRLEKITGKTPAAAIVKKGISYADTQVAGQIRKMKETERKGTDIKHLDTDLLTYLDILRRSKHDLSPTAKNNRNYLIGILAKHPVRDDMYSKALSSSILFESDNRKEAAAALQSLMEHTVEKEGMGRYFDTRLAKSVRESYKIPTQTAAIEALRLIRPADRNVLQQMLTWLIQAKRTQSWNSERNTIEAVYALLLSADSASGMLHFATSAPQRAVIAFKGGRTADITSDGTQADETLGYVRRDFSLESAKESPDRLVITKNDDGIAWGGIYSRVLVPVSDVVSSGKELTVKRECLVLRGNRYVPIATGVVPKTGDHIRVRYTIEAARDFDFVSLQDIRPACFEPLRQLSGYMWNNGEAYYYASGDVKSGFFFEKMSKGVHTLECDYIADRVGRYSAGTATVQCLYAPEFVGTAAGFIIEIQK